MNIESFEPLHKILCLSAIIIEQGVERNESQYMLEGKMYLFAALVDYMGRDKFMSYLDKDPVLENIVDGIMEKFDQLMPEEK